MNIPRILQYTQNALSKTPRKQDTVSLCQTKKAAKSRSECLQLAGHCIATQVPHKPGSISLEWFQWHPILSKQYAYTDTEGLDPINRVWEKNTTNNNKKMTKKKKKREDWSGAPWEKN